MNRKENADSGSLQSAAGENPSEAYSEGCECAGYRNKLWEKLKTGNKVYGFSVNALWRKLQARRYFLRLFLVIHHGNHQPLRAQIHKRSSLCTARLIWGFPMV